MQFHSRSLAGMPLRRRQALLVAASVLPGCRREAGGPPQEGHHGAGEAQASAPVHRMLRPESGTHFYTTSAAELQEAQRLGMVYQDAPFASCDARHGRPVYRFADVPRGTYFYTASAVERDWLLLYGPHLRFEGIGFHVLLRASVNSFAVHRLRHPTSHHVLYACDAQERDRLVRRGWDDEGPAFHACRHRG